jgi:hypothetical protein
MAKYEITLTDFQGSVERHYFAVLELLKDFGFQVSKTHDTFNSSITSSFWGSIEQRRTLQQEKAAQYLGAISSMVKAIFQLLRDLKMTDKRIEYYKQAKDGPDKKSAEIALKAIWVDLVEGAGKNPSSVYGLATQVGFSTLPDLFFDICPRDEKELKKTMEEVHRNGINKKVVEILRRKLFQYMQWRNKTEKELDDGRVFKLAYLRQHFNVIRLYLSWIRPYLKNVKRLRQEPNRHEDLLEMADTAIADIELFAYKIGDNKKYFPTITVTIEYRTVPELAYQQEYQRGPIHIGKTRIIFDGNPMLLDEMNEKFRKDQQEDITLLKDLFAATTALEDDLIKYLTEAQEEDPEGKVGKKLEKSKTTPKGITMMFEPFKDIGKGFKDMFGALTFQTKPDKNEKKKPKALIIYEQVPADILKATEERQENQKTKRRSKTTYKKRDEFETDKEFKEYIKYLKNNNTIAEQKELADVKGTTEGEGLMWTIYDTLKKQVGAVRW